MADEAGAEEGLEAQDQEASRVAAVAMAVCS